MAAASKTKTSQTAMRRSDVMLAATIALAAALMLGAALYVVKSALGVDLMAGPSPLHDLLYNLQIW